MPPRSVPPSSPDYPPRLHALPHPPPSLWLSGPLVTAPTVAIVGTRKPLEAAETFAADLAGEIVRAGGIVVSGGATGIDAAAHRGAIAQGGPTWVVLPTGHRHVYPECHASLYDSALAANGALVWPFEPDTIALRPNFFLRNGVLVALADVVVVVQAGIPSGALNAAKWAKDLGRPLWVVAGAPWMGGFRGCLAEIDRGGARVLTSSAAVLASAGLARQRPLPEPSRGPSSLGRTLDPEEADVLRATSTAPRHVDEIADRAGLSAAALATPLLTLALENVLVEGPEGFFRRVEPR